jgi:hypothetical protein
MGNYAVVKDNFVENLIACDEGQIPEMEEVLECELVDAVPFGLSIGDMKVDGNWTRNIDGVQTILTERATYQELEAALNAIQAKLEALGV